MKKKVLLITVFCLTVFCKHDLNAQPLELPFTLPVPAAAIWMPEEAVVTHHQESADTSIPYNPHAPIGDANGKRGTKLNPDHFSLFIEFTKEDVNLGAYGNWEEVWLSRAPHYVNFAGAVNPYVELEDSYAVKRVVYINTPDEFPQTKKGGKDISRGIFKVPENADPKLLKKYNIPPSRINYTDPAVAAAMGTGENPHIIPIEDPYADPYWRDRYIKIAESDEDCIIKKNGGTGICYFRNPPNPPEGDLPVQGELRLITINYYNGVYTLCPEGNCSPGENFWVNDFDTPAVAEVKDPSYGQPDHIMEYVPVRLKMQAVGNLDVITLGAAVSKYTEADPNVYLSYNLASTMPVSAYLMLSNDFNTFCLWGYDADAFNSVHYAIKEGGYDAGFEQFKKTVKFYDYDKDNPSDRRCGDDDFIGFVQLNKKTPQGEWQGWPSCWDEGGVLEKPSVVMLGEKEGCPFAIGDTKTIASGGTFGVAEMIISDDPNALRTLPNLLFPGRFSGTNTSIPAADDPPKPCPPVGIDAPDPAAGVLIYPNPTDGMLYIELPERCTTLNHAAIFNMLGQKLLETTPYACNYGKIDISHLPAGMYVVQIYMGDDIVTRRVVKE